MTGATVYIIKGDQAVMGKVRHDGNDIVEWIQQNKDLMLKRYKRPYQTFKNPPLNLKNIWKAYYNWRKPHYGSFDARDEIDSKYQENGFKFILPKGKKVDQFAHELLAKQEEKEKKKKGEPRNSIYEGYLCGYDDYRVVIDLDKETITINEMTLEKFEEEDKKYVPPQMSITSYQGCCQCHVCPHSPMNIRR